MKTLAPPRTPVNPPADDLDAFEAWLDRHTTSPVVRPGHSVAYGAPPAAADDFEEPEACRCGGARAEPRDR